MGSVAGRKPVGGHHRDERGRGENDQGQAPAQDQRGRLKRPRKEERGASVREVRSEVPSDREPHHAQGHHDDEVGRDVSTHPSGESRDKPGNEGPGQDTETKPSDIQ